MYGNGVSAEIFLFYKGENVCEHDVCPSVDLECCDICSCNNLCSNKLETQDVEIEKLKLLFFINFFIQII